MSFEEKVILITGGGSGIGAATAIHLASLGAYVLLVDRNSETLQATVTQCNAVAAKFGHTNITPAAVPLVADITIDAEKIIDTTIKTFGKLDVLVNNAGTLRNDSIESENVMNNYDPVMNTNLKSVIQLTTLAVPFLIKTKGNIVNVSSVSGSLCLDSVLVYSLSKAALNQFTKCVALELAPKGVRVNSVSPGSTRTNILNNAGVNESFKKLLIPPEMSHPLGRIGEPEDIAYAIAFLASTNASFITGTVLPVDGGRSLANAKPTN